MAKSQNIVGVLDALRKEYGLEQEVNDWPDAYRKYYSKPFIPPATPDWYKGPGGGDDGISIGDVFSPFKSVGMAALNTLSVPQAVAFTLASKAIEGVTGREGMDWSDLAGGFSEDYQGFKEILEQSGVPEDSKWTTWAGLAGDIVLDPLWFAAPVKAVRTAAKTPMDVAKAFRSMRDPRAIAAAQKAGKEAGPTEGWKEALGKFAAQSDHTFMGRPEARAARDVFDDYVAAAAPVAAPAATGSANDIASALASLADPTAIASAERVGTRDKLSGLPDMWSGKVSDDVRPPPGEVAVKQDIVDMSDEMYDGWDYVDENGIVGGLRDEQGLITPVAAERAGAEKSGRVGTTFKTEDDETLIGELGRRLRGEKKPEPKWVDKDGKRHLMQGETENRVALSIGLAPWKQSSRFNKQIAFGPSWARHINSSSWFSRKIRGIVMLPVEKAMHQLGRSAREQRGDNATAIFKQQEDFAARGKDLAERRSKVGRTGWEEKSAAEIMDIRSTAMSLVSGARNLATDSESVKKLADFEKNMVDEMILTTDDIKLIDYYNARYLAEYRLANGGRMPDQGGVAVGGYGPQGPDPRSLSLLRLEGRMNAENNIGRGNRTQTDMNSEKKRQFGSIFNYMTGRQFTSHLTDMGMSQATANKMMQIIKDSIPTEYGKELSQRLKGKSAEEFLGFAPTERQLKIGGVAEPINPELNFFSLVKRKNEAEIEARLDRHITMLLEQNGLIKRTFDEDGNLTFTGVIDKSPPMKTRDGIKMEGDPSYWTRRKTEFLKNERLLYDDTADLGRILLSTFRFMKLAFTQPWPMHYWNNMLGDLFNSMVNAGPTAAGKATKSSFTIAGRGRKEGEFSIPTLRYGDKYARAAAMERGVMDEVFEVGGVKYNGAQLSALAHLTGLGRGFTGEIGENLGDQLARELGHTTKMFEAAKAPWTTYFRFMQRQNVTREDAMRFRTWVNHMEDGKNPIEASLATIDGVFDYGALSRFEKVWMRNTLMFYTWMRLNTPFQWRAMFKNPGLYASYGDIERGRPKSPNEPGYVSELGLLPVPLLGNMSIGAPWADLHKSYLPFTSDTDTVQSYTSDYLSALNPIAKIPLEIATNKNIFTGAPVRQFPGQKKEMPFGPLNPLLTFLPGIGYQRQRKGGELVPAMSARGEHIISSVLGPMASVGERFPAQHGGVESRPQNSWQGWITQIAGIGRTVEPSPYWADAAKVREARKKADLTRLRNAEALVPTYTGG